MIRSLLGAMASAPMASDGRLSVFDTHVPALFMTQMPPWAAARIHSPVLGRMASAPIRPLTGSARPEPRVGCRIGSGPIADQAVLNVAGPEGGPWWFCWL